MQVKFSLDSKKVLAEQEAVMISNMKADTARPKEPKRAKSQIPKKQRVPAREAAPKETGGPKGLEPTRYGDWENNGRCTDF